jgi:hypothetical protein
METESSLSCSQEPVTPSKPAQTAMVLICILEISGSNLDQNDIGSFAAPTRGINEWIRFHFMRFAKYPAVYHFLMYCSKL